MADAADLKDQGNAAFRAGELQRAMELYSQSLALDRSSSVCYHNRAVCHLKLGAYEASLRDADEAISWNQAYAKAYSTRGSALLHLGRHADAAASFRRGLELEPGNATLASNLRHAETALARASSSAGTPTTTPASAGSSASSTASSTASSARRAGSGAAGASPAAGGAGGAAAAAGRVLLAGIPFPASRVSQGLVLARLALLALLLMFLLPGTGALGASAYRALLLLAAATHAVDVGHRCGVPTSRADVKEWVSRAAFDPFFHLVFLPLIFAPASSRPRLAVALLAVDFDVLHALEFLHAAAEARAPAVAARMTSAAAAVLPWVARKPAAEVARLTVKQRWAAVNESLFSTNALLEVVETVTLVFGLLWASSRAPLQALLMTQLLQFRFATSEHTRAACGQIDAALSALTSHPSCPAAVGRGYGALRRFLRSRVQTPEEMQAAAARQAAGGAAGGGGGGCAIM